jgi:peptidoglycan hydrolase-like protein with peptidoglycan-binding domain
MLLFRAGLASVLAAAICFSPAFAEATQKKTASKHAHSTHRTSSKKTQKKKLRGQQAIDSARVTEIQQALIREHYMTGEPNGQWDTTTTSAMKKFQADQGWQTKLMPDSRALKKLGLGPDYSRAINADTSSASEPQAASRVPPMQEAGFAAASGVNR